MSKKSCECLHHFESIWSQQVKSLCSTPQQIDSPFFSQTERLRPCSSQTLRNMGTRAIWITTMLNKRCRVCGWLSDDAPWGKDGATPSFEICDCCGVQFGYEDCNAASIVSFRKTWLDKGASWFNKDVRPENWSLEDQLKLATQEEAKS